MLRRLKDYLEKYKVQKRKNYIKLLRAEYQFYGHMHVYACNALLCNKLNVG